MSAIEPSRTDLRRKVKKYSAGVRFWHWMNALVIAGSLITVLINSTLLDRGTAGSLVSAGGGAESPAITEGTAREVMHSLEDRVWDFHIYFGYALAGLVLFRLLAEIFRRRDDRFLHQFSLVFRKYRSGKPGKTALHDLVVKTLYIVFYLLIVIMVVTGLSMVFKSDLGISKSLGHAIKEVHGFCMYLILAFIGIHIAGVYLAERKDSQGIVSDMINGGDQKH